MQETRGLQSEQNGRLEALRAKHAALSDQIKQHQKSPATSSLELQELKAQRLQLKDLIYQEKEDDRQVS